MLTISNKTEIIEFLKRHITSLNSDSCYVWYDDEGCEDEGHYEDLAFHDCKADYYEYGCSKLVLFYEELPQWVIKIPFLGEYYEEDDTYREFECANKNDLFPTADGNDYCAIEAYLTEEAAHYGLEDMFAQTFFLTEINGVKIYISQKIENNYYSCSSKSLKDENSADQASWLRESYCKTHMEKYVLTAADLAFFIDSYGLWQTELLIAFLTDYCVDDLHHGNIGFDDNYNIKILDYSSFYN